jgi:putative ABC transport system permease protein
MTLGSFVIKNAFRNRRRSLLTILSVMFSLLLLTMMMTIWRGFYMDQGPPDSGLRLMTRHRVSLSFFLPAYYREKIRAVRGVTHVVPMTFFGGRYKDDRPENFFVQFATDPGEYMEVAADKIIDPNQVKAWERDRTGCIVDSDLARRHGWKLGDRISIQGTIFPTNLDLTIRGIYTIDPPNNSLYFNAAYLEESVLWFKGRGGFFFIRVDSPQSVTAVAHKVDDLFRSSPQPTRSESEQAFRLGFIAMLGNVKAFILSICGAVVFAILLVSATTMAMTIRERTREVALLKTLGFTREKILALFLGEAVSLALLGGLLGVVVATALMRLIVSSPRGIGIPAAMRVTLPTMLIALCVAGVVGLLSALLPSYNASQRNIVEGLRHIG